MRDIRKWAFLVAFGLLPGLAFAGEYGTRVRACEGEAVVFPDFQLRPWGVRGSSLEGGGSMVFFDYQLEGRSEKTLVSWGGTGMIAPQGFCFEGANYVLEHSYSDRLNVDLATDEIVIWKLPKLEWLCAEGTPFPNFRLSEWK